MTVIGAAQQQHKEEDDEAGGRFRDADRFGINSRDDVRQGMQEWRFAFPDRSLANETIVQDGDTVRWTERQSGPIWPSSWACPATHRRLEGVLTMHEPLSTRTDRCSPTARLSTRSRSIPQLGLMDDEREGQARVTNG